MGAHTHTHPPAPGFEDQGGKQRQRSLCQGPGPKLEERWRGWLQPGGYRGTLVPQKDANCEKDLYDPLHLRHKMQTSTVWLDAIRLLPIQQDPDHRRMLVPALQAPGCIKSTMGHHEQLIVQPNLKTKGTSSGARGSVAVSSTGSTEEGRGAARSGATRTSAFLCGARPAGISSWGARQRSGSGRAAG